MTSNTAPKTRWVLYDDSDSNIVYEGPWFIRNDQFPDYGVAYGTPYRDSQHETNQTASLSLPYTGSRIRVLGTSSSRNITEGHDPSWDCLLNGQSIGTNPPWTEPINNWPLCESSAQQPEGAYILTLNVTIREGTPFWVDQIRFLPSTNASLVHPIVFIEQVDPAIQYPTGNWERLEINAVLTLQAGSTMRIDFSGTKATWVAWAPSGYPAGASSATYVLDDREPVTFAIPGMSPGSPPAYNRLLFDTGTVDMGPHTLVVTYLGPAAPLTFDYLLVEDGDIMMPDSSVPPSNSIYSTPSPKPSDRTTNLPNSPSTSSKEDGTPVGAVVGGSIGGATLIAIFVLLFLFTRKRQKRRVSIHLEEDYPMEREVNNHGASELEEHQVTPFLAPSQRPLPTSPAGGSLSYLSLGSSTSSPNHSSPSSTPSPLRMNTMHTPHTPAWSSLDLYASTNADDTFSPRHTANSQAPLLSHNRDQKLVPLRRNTQDQFAPLSSAHTSINTPLMENFTGSTQPTFVHHEDSGIRIPPQRPQIVDVPPSYTPS